MKRIFTSLSALATLTILVPCAQAQLAFDFNPIISNGVAGNQTLGYSFNVLKMLDVNALYVLSLTDFPLLGDVQVGLWNNGGTLLTSTTVNAISPSLVTPSVSGIGNFFGTVISPLTLAPGTYVIGAFYSNSNDGVVVAFPPITNTPSVSFNVGLQSSNTGSLSFPNVNPGFPSLAGYFGPSLGLVPEPGTVALFSGMLVMGGLVVRRRK